jgi:peptidoglycan/xylan/chitin deacetylase (PgdA/CDA1 family)
MENMIVEATGVEPKFSRFPGGTNNTVSITVNNGTPIMPELLQGVLALGITPVDWNAGGMDAVTPVPSSDTIVKGVVSQCKYLKNAVILLHDSSTHSSSVEAVPQIIKKLKAMGFTFKPLTSSDEAVRFTPALAK